MKQFLIRTAAVLTAFSACSGSAAFSAFAAEAAEWKKFFISVKSVCPNYEPLSDDMMYITPGSHLPVRVEIIQHSPERDPLLLYDKTITGGSAEYTYSFAVERGDYLDDAHCAADMAEARVTEGLEGLDPYLLGERRQLACPDASFQRNYLPMIRIRSWTRCNP